MRGFCAKDLRSPPGALRHIRGNAVTPTADRIEEATTPAVGAPWSLRGAARRSRLWRTSLVAEAPVHPQVSPVADRHSGFRRPVVVSSAMTSPQPWRSPA